MVPASVRVQGLWKETGRRSLFYSDRHPSARGVPTCRNKFSIFANEVTIAGCPKDLSLAGGLVGAGTQAGRDGGRLGGGGRETGASLCALEGRQLAECAVDLVGRARLQVYVP